MRKLVLVAFVLGPFYGAEPRSSAADREDKGSASLAGVLAKCLDDLSSKDPRVRERAAGLLGFYWPSEAVRPLMELLKSRSAYARQGAARSLAEIGPRARAAVPALSALLKDPDKDVVQSAASALGKIGGAAEPVVPLLIELLKSKDPSIRAASAMALWGIGPEAKRAVPTLIERLRNEDPDSRLFAARALGRIGKEARAAVPALRKCLNDSDFGVRGEAAFALSGISPVEDETVRALIRAMLDPDKYVREEARLSLSRIRRQAAPVLCQALTDKNVQLRRHIVEFLGGGWGEEVEGAAPGLVKALKDDDESVRRGAAAALGNIGSANHGTIPALVAGLKDKSPRVRSAAATALGSIGTKGTEVVPAVAKLLKDKDDGVRASAATALARLGPTAVPALIDALKDRGIRGVVIDALRTMKSKEAIPALVAMLKDEDPQARLASIKALGAMGAHAKPAVGALIPLLRAGPLSADQLQAITAHVTDLDSSRLAVRTHARQQLESLGIAADRPLRHALENARSVEARQRLTQILVKLDGEATEVSVVIAAMGEMGPGAAKGLPALIAILADKDKPSAIREAAAVALGQIDKAGTKSVLAALRHALGDGEDKVRSGAVKALESLGPAALPALPELMVTLQDKDPFVASTAASAIGAIGPRAKAAIPALIAAVKKREYAGESAIWALGKMGQEARLAIPVLIDVLKDENIAGLDRAFAAHVLRGLGPASKDAIPVLIELLLDSEGSLTADVEKALPRIDPDWFSRGASAVLIKGLNNNDPFARQSAALALRNAGPRATKAVPHLIPLLKDKHDLVRRDAAAALGAIGPAAKAALPALQALLKDDNDSVRESAARALKRIKAMPAAKGAAR